VKELKEKTDGPTPNVDHDQEDRRPDPLDEFPSGHIPPDKAEAASPFWCPDCGYAISACVHRTAYRVQPRQEVAQPAPVWGVRLAVPPAAP
jgi:hypothetical protein